VADETEDMAYVVSCRRCRRAAYLCRDRPEVMADAADDIARLLQQGYIVERVTIEAAREWAPCCTCDAAERAG